MEHTKHIWRAVLLLIACLLTGIVVRHFMIPESFGREGFYRYTSLGEFMTQPLVHSGPKACAECHAEQQDAQEAGPHASVSCHECHPPLAPHSKDGEKIADMPSKRSYRVCGNCHRPLRARPKSHTQIAFRAHLEELGVLEPEDPIPDGSCLVCHDPHSTKEKE